MPIYEYRCSKCGQTFEALVRNSGDKPDSCPKCGSKKMEKQFSAFSAVSSSSSPSFACPSSGSCPAGTCSTGTCPFGAS